MPIINTFEEVQKEIALHEQRIEECKTEIKYNSRMLHATEPHEVSGMSLDGMPKGNLSPWTADRCIENMRRYEHMIEIEEEAIKHLEKSMEEQEQILKSLNGLEYKVVYMHVIEGKTLRQIASELGYSEEHIRRVNAKCYKDATE